MNGCSGLYVAFWDDPTPDECCAVCARREGEKCPVTGVDFGINGLYEMGETKCTGFRAKEEE